MTELAPQSEFQQSQIGSFIVQLEHSLRLREVDTQYPEEVRKAISDKDFWYGKRGFWTRRSSTHSPPERTQELVCFTLSEESQKLGSTSTDVQSLKRMLNISSESPTLDDLRAATGGTSGGGERTAEPAKTKEKLPRFRDRDEQIAYRTYQEAWNPNPLMANRADYWFENERARLRARGEAGQASEKREARPPLRWLLDEINASLRERGADPNDREQVEAQIRNDEFWLGTPESFWEKLATGSGQKPEDFQEEKCREVLEDIRTRRGGHDDRAELRTLFGLPPGYKFDLYDLIDITNGFITHSQLVEQEASLGQDEEVEVAPETPSAPEVAAAEVAPMQDLLKEEERKDQTQRWQRFRGSLTPSYSTEPEATVVEEGADGDEDLTNGLRDAFLKAQQKQSRVDKGGGKARKRQKIDAQVHRAQELQEKWRNSV